MARDRKRAKQRQQRLQRGPQGRGAEGRAEDRAAQGSTSHENRPGELEHASGEVEEFDAALVAGANGEVAEEDVDLVAEEQLEPAAASVDPAARAPAAAGPRAGGNRIVNFLRASWAELQRVQWPDRRQVAQATGVVLGFVAIAGAYLGVADYLAQKVVDAIL